MAAWLDVCKFTPTTGGTTDWTFLAAITGYQSPALAGVVNGTLYKYRAESADLTQWEMGEGAYNTGTGVLARTTVLYNSSGTGTATGQSGAGTKINFTLAPQVAVVALKEDLISIQEANAFTAAQKSQARTNILSVGIIRKQKFTANGTYTPDANLLYAIVEGVGGGAGGGGAAGTLTAFFGAGGGGSGAYSRLIVDKATIGASQAVTIGAGGAGGAAGSNNGSVGGDTSLGSILIAKGGSGGLFGSVAQTGAGGAGGSTTGGVGDIVSAGDPGSPSIYNNGSSAAGITPGGNGGSAALGGGGAPGPAFTGSAATAGTAGTGFGSGGSGAVASNTVSTAAGGAGSGGLIFITEFCSQ